MTNLEKVLRYTRSTKSRKARLDSFYAKDAEFVVTREELAQQLDSVPNQHKASFLYIPAAREAGKSYSLIGPDLTIDRNSSATEVNRDLQLSTVGNHVPRIEFDANGPKGHLVEPQETNLISRSYDLSTGVWLLTNSGGVSVSVAEESSPFNTSIVSTIIPSQVNGYHRVGFNLGNSGGSIDAYGYVIVKASGYSRISLGLGGAVSGQSVVFDLSNGVIDNSLSVPADLKDQQIKSLGDGWYMCGINVGTLTTGFFWVNVLENYTIDPYIGDGVSGIKLAHAQVVNSRNGFTSPIITNGAAATRLGTQIRDAITGSDILTSIFSGLVWHEGTVLLDVEIPNITVTSAQAKYSLRNSDITSNVAMAYIDSGGVSIYSYTSSKFLTQRTKGRVKLILRWKTGEGHKGYANGIYGDSSSTDISIDRILRMDFADLAYSELIIRTHMMIPIGLSHEQCLQLSQL